MPYAHHMIFANIYYYFFYFKGQLSFILELCNDEIVNIYKKSSLPLSDEAIDTINKWQALQNQLLVKSRRESIFWKPSLVVKNEK